MAATVIVVLGCRVGPRGELSAAASRRVSAAAAAFREHPSARLLVTGGKSWSGSIEAQVMAEALVAAGVPPARIGTEERSLSTRQNAQLTRPLLHPGELRGVLVVTCDWHLPRALACFRRAGIVAQGWAAPAPDRGLARRCLRAQHERLKAIWGYWAWR